MKTLLALSLATLLTIGQAGCQKNLNPVVDQSGSDNIDLFSMYIYPPSHAVAPSPLVQVPFQGRTLEFWPYTGRDFTSNGQDPINLIFFGKCDPLSIRAALKSLDGNRPDFPPAPPFTSTWRDGIGEEQVVYGTPSGWTGGTIQMECGEHNSIRVHLRLFKVGDWTVGGAHFEVLIPGTSDHEVLSWELAEQLIVYDFVRSGLLDADVPMALTDQINPSPFKVIRAPIYNGLPVELRMLIGGPLDNVTEDVPTYSDGRATILNLAHRVQWQPETFVQSFDCVYGQAVPKPFCASGPGDYLYVTGPVSLTQTTTLTEDGEFSRIFSASGTLNAIPIDPSSGEIVGAPLQANVREQHNAWLLGDKSRVSSLVHQILLPNGDGGSSQLFVQMRVNSSGADGYRRLEQCADADSPTAGTTVGPTILRPHQN